jgi:Mrp family chromosome partitioning ATPase
VPCIEIEFDKSRGRVYVNILELGYLYDVLAEYDLMPNEDLTVWRGSMEKDMVKKLIEDLKEKGFDKITYFEY